MKKQKLITVDLFSGCGGMSLGFQNGGFEVVAAFDNWAPAIDVYRDNFKHHAQVLDLSTAETKNIVGHFKPELIIGGPPCQDFSSAGPNNSSSARSDLVRSFVDVIEAARPRFFVLENVPRIRLSHIFISSETRLREMGYGITTKILDASYCGVPQQRKRLFLVGALKAKHGFLDSYLTKKLSKNPLTLRDFFGSKLDTDYYFRVPTNYNRRGVFSVDEPSVTIRGVDRPIPRGYPKHPEDPVSIGPQVRAFTVRERALIQTFPKSFKFNGTKTNLNGMIGNAVPVKLAEFVAKALSKYIEESDVY